jgi:hypothetical protein
MTECGRAMEDRVPQDGRHGKAGLEYALIPVRLLKCYPNDYQQAVNRYSAPVIHTFRCGSTDAQNASNSIGVVSKYRPSPPRNPMLLRRAVIAVGNKPKVLR